MNTIVEAHNVMLKEGINKAVSISPLILNFREGVQRYPYLTIDNLIKYNQYINWYKIIEVYPKSYEFYERCMDYIDLLSIKKEDNIIPQKFITKYRHKLNWSFQPLNDRYNEVVNSKLFEISNHGIIGFIIKYPKKSILCKIDYIENEIYDIDIFIYSYSNRTFFNGINILDRNTANSWKLDNTICKVLVKKEDLYCLDDRNIIRAKRIKVLENLPK